MPKPFVPEGLTLETRARQAGGAFIAAKVREVRAYVAPALRAEVEGIHDMRVAAKRLRESLRLFRRLAPGKPLAKIMPLVGSLNDLLGQVRDPDVLMENARALAQGSPEAAPFIEQSLQVWQEGRNRTHVEFVARWRWMSRDQRLLDRLSRLARAMARAPRKRAGLELDRFAYCAVVARCERLRQPLADALGLRESAGLHLLRISVKRLKYTMEPFLALLPGMAEPYTTVSDLQETIGLAHDLDVLEAALHDAAARSGGLDDPAVVTLFGAFTDERAARYATAWAATEAFGTLTWYRQLLDAME
jgi:CHAD domain-containing protein